jgi:hypothetical protein
VFSLGEKAIFDVFSPSREPIVVAWTYHRQCGDTATTIVFSTARTRLGGHGDIAVAAVRHGNMRPPNRHL